TNAALRFRMPEKTPATPAPAAEKSAAKNPRGRTRVEHAVERTVFVMRGEKPEPVQIKTGISDGIFTEVTDGLNEEDRFVVSMTSPRATPPPANPFGGG